MSIGRKILFFLCFDAIPGDPFKQETLGCYLEALHEYGELNRRQWPKIYTIKKVREQTAWSLKDSKAFVDHLLVDVGLLDKDYFRDSILRRDQELRNLRTQ